MNDPISKEQPKKFASKLFNLTWHLIKKKDCNQVEIDRMTHAAHASRYHWEIAADAVNITRSEWLISQAYAILHQAELCHFHADRCLQVTLENNLNDFNLAFAYETMARAKNLAHKKYERAKYFTLTQNAGSKITDPNDRKTIMPGSTQ